MGKHKQFRDIENSANFPIWVVRINSLMEERQITQQTLAQGCGLSASLISDWIGLNKKKKHVLSEPKIVGFQKIAKYLGVSVDYLLGEVECQTPSDEEIHKITGLSDIAIRHLKKVNGFQNGDTIAEKKILILNYLIENMDDSSLFESLYDYLIGDFVFPGKEDDMAGAYMIDRLPSGRKGRNVVFKELFSQAAFVNVQHDIMRLKDKALEENKCTKE